MRRMIMKVVIFPVLFDVVEYINTSNIKSKHDVLVIEFNGMDVGLIKNIKELI